MENEAKTILEKSSQVKGSKKIKITILLLSIIVFLISLIALLFFTKTKTKRNYSFISPENARAMTYEEVQEGDEAVNGTDNVSFIAYCLRDINDDGYVEHLKGTCKQIGYADTLYMELSVKTSGKLINGKIELGDTNFFFQTDFPEDRVFKRNYISQNTREIEFKDLNNGTQKTIRGKITSGSWISYKKLYDKSAIKNSNYYSKTNSIVLTGTYVTENGTEIAIRKKVPLTVDWYGTGRATIYNTEKTYYDIAERLDEKNEKVNLELRISTEETDRNLFVSKNYVEGIIPQYNGFNPIIVTCKSGNTVFNYDEETRKFTIVRENANTSNSYDLNISYPLEAYITSAEPRINLVVPVSTYFELYNNPNDEFENPYKTPVAEGTIKYLFREEIPVKPKENYVPSTPHEPIPMEPVELPMDTSINYGFFKDTPGAYAVSKEKAISEYQGIDHSEDRYPEYWVVYTGTHGETSGAVIEEKSELGDGYNSNLFVKSNGTYESMDNILSNVGIGFGGTFLKEDGWIKVYDAETDELIVSLSDGKWSRFTDSSPYMYKYPVKHIRIETSETLADSYMSVINIKEIDDEYIVENYTREEFYDFNYIRSDFKATLGSGEESSCHYEAPYDEPFSTATISIGKKNFSTQVTTKNTIIKVNAGGKQAFNQLGWINGSFLIEFPQEVIDVKVNGVIIDNAQVKIKNYEVIEKNNKRFIKINTENLSAKRQSYTITISCDISPDPRSLSASKSVTLYASNYEVRSYANYSYYNSSSDYRYYYCNTRDVYDVNNNLIENENVLKTSAVLNLIAPKTLLMTQIASEFDNNNTVRIAPQIADIRPDYPESSEGKTAKITVELKNNNTDTISEIRVIGVIPYENNRHIIVDGDLCSEFTAQMLENGVTIPNNLEGIATVYYSDQLRPTKDLAEESNNWKTKEEVTNWDTIKTFLIDFDRDYTLAKEAKIIFEYGIRIPNDVELNKISYSEVGADFCLNTEEGKYRTNAETNPLGFRVAEKYNLELSKYHIEKDILVPEATYRVTEDGEENGTTEVTGEDGKFLIKELYAEKTYIIEEIKSPSEYELNNDIIKFTSHVNRTTGEMTIEKIEGTTRGNINSVKGDDDIYNVQVNVEDESKVRMKIIKSDRNDGTLLKGVKYKISGGDISEEGKNIVTDENGEVLVKELNIGTVYTLEEIKANGYYLNKSMSFKVLYSNGTYSIEIVDNGENYTEEEMGIKSYSITELDGFPVATFELENDKIPTYNLEITKIKRVTNLQTSLTQEIQNENTDEITYLAGAMFRLYKDGKAVTSVVTDENGKATIEGLYIYEEDRDVDQTYILKEAAAPEGYARAKEITFKVVNNSGTLELVEITSENQNPKTYISDGSKVNIIVEDSPSFRLIKKDGETEETLSNVKFAIYNLDNGNEPATNSKGETIGTKEIVNGKEYYTLVTDENGEITVNLPEGIYRVIEVETYEKYSKDKNEYYFGIGTSGEGRTGINADFAILVGEDKKEIIRDSIITSDEGIIAVGSFSGESLSLDENTKLLGNDYDDGMIIKYNKSGNIEWAKAIVGDDETVITNVIETSDKGILAVVKHKGDITFEDSSMLTKEGEENNIGLIKFNQAGEKVWAKEFIYSEDDSGQYIEPKDVIETKDGDFIVLSEIDCGTIKVGDNITLYNGGNSGLISKCNSTGDTEWADVLLEGYVESLSKIFEKEDGNILIIGRDYNYWAGIIIEYNSIGEYQNEEHLGSELKDIIKLDDGGYIIAGYFSWDSLDNDIIADEYGMIKYNAEGIAEEFIQLPELRSIAVYDNGFYILGYNSLYNYSIYGDLLSTNDIGYTDCYESNAKISVASDNSCLISYSTEYSFETDFGNKVTLIKDTNYNYDGVLVKYRATNLVNPETRLLRGVGRGDSDDIVSVASTSDGGYIALGNFAMNSTISSAYEQYEDNELVEVNGGFSRIDLDDEHYVVNNAIIKYSGTKEIEWIREVEGRLCKVISTTDGGFLVECNLWGRIGDGADFISGNTIIKYDASGNIEWYKEIEIPDFNSVIQTQDGGYLVGGSFRSRINLGNGIVLASNGSSDGIIIKYDSNGMIEWVNVIGAEYAEKVTDVCQLTDGTYVVVGGLSSDLVDLGQGITLEDSKGNGFIVSYSIDGKIEKANEFASFANVDSNISSIVATDDGGYAIAGYSSTTIDFGNDNIINTGSYIMKFDIAENVEWARNIIGYADGYSEKSFTIKMKQTRTGDYLLYGRHDNNGSDYEYMKVDDALLPYYFNGDYRDTTVFGVVFVCNQFGDVKWGDAIGSNETGSSKVFMFDATDLVDGTIVTSGAYSCDNIEKGAYRISNYSAEDYADGFIWEVYPQIGADEIQELELYNYRKELKIKTSVKRINGVTGGTISGESDGIYEIVKYGDDSTKEIKMVPNRNYEIAHIIVNGEEILFEPEENGSYTLPQFENVTENMTVEVQFVLKDNKITINKVDGETGELLTGAEFKIEQFEERNEPISEEIIGELVDNGEPYTSDDMTEEVTESTLGSLTENETYYFVNRGGKYYPTNSKTYQGDEGASYSDANSYIPIDLSESTGIYCVVVNASISSETGCDYGYVNITEDTYMPYSYDGISVIEEMSGSIDSQDYTAMIEGGQTQYLHFVYHKDSSVDADDDQMVINSVKVFKASENTYNFEMSDGKYKALSNRGVDGVNASSYIPLDLTEYQGRYRIKINAEISTEGGDFGFIKASTSTERPDYNSSSNRIYLTGIQSARNYYLEVSGGMMQYLHLAYCKDEITNIIGNDEFTINSISIELSSSDLYQTTIETNSLGKAITQIPFGKYSITETRAPEGYLPMAEPLIIDFTSDDGAQHEFNIENEKSCKVIVHHYLKGTDTSVVDDEIIEGRIGEEYETVPRVNISGYELEKDENDVEILPENRTGTYSREDQEVTYFYIRSGAQLVVHHYIDGTSTKVLLKDGSVAGDEIFYGDVDEEYTTSAISDELLDDKYELIEIPENANDRYENSLVEVTYYYREIERDITIHKTDFNTEEPLKGVAFKINKQGDNVEQTIQYYILSNLVNNGDYGFVEEDGKYIPTNGATYQISNGNSDGIDSSVANSYIKIDLTELLGDYILRFDAYTSSEEYFDYGFAAITENIIPPEYNSNENIISESGFINEYTYTSSVLEGGKIYYLHLGYLKDSASYEGEDQIAFSNIALYADDGVTKVSDVGQLHEKTEVSYYYTDSKGDINLTLKQGLYEITEIETLEGYALDSETKTFTVDRNTVNGTEIKITNDRPKGTVTIHNYKAGTTEFIQKDGEPIEDEVRSGYIGDIYITKGRDDVEGYTPLNEPDNSSGEYINGNIDVTYYYDTVAIPATVTVHYYLDGTTTPVKNIDGLDVEDVTIEGFTGETYETEEPENIAEYYELVAEPINKSGPISSSEIEVIYYYKLKEYTYTIEYYYDGEIDDDKTETIEETYNVEISTYPDKNIEGYKLQKTEGLPLTIKTNEEDNIIKIYYIIDEDNTKPVTYTVEYYKDNVKVEGDTEEITERVQVLQPNTITIDRSLISDENKYDGYKLDSTYPEEVPDVVNTETTIKVFYVKKDAKVVIKHIDRETEEVLETETREGKVGDVIQIAEKDFEDYVIVESPDNETITMTEDDIEVCYYYAKVSEGVIEKHIDISTGTVLYEELHDGNSGDTYETEEKEFDGYLIATNKEYYNKLVEENSEFLAENEVETVEEYLEKNNLEPDGIYIPENSTGPMTEEAQEVKYYYITKVKLIVKYIDIKTGEEIEEEQDGEMISATVEIEGRLNESYEAPEKEFDKYILVTNRGFYKKYFEEHPEGLEAEDVESIEEYMDKYDINPRAVYMPENAEGIFGVTENPDGTSSYETIVMYYFGVEREVRIKFYDKNTGEEISEETIKIGPDGDPYDVTEDQKEVEGYTLIEVPENPEGTYEEENEPRRYSYAKNTKVLVSYVDSETGEEIENANYEIDGYEGKDYETEEKEFDNYELQETDGDSEGIMGREPTRVTYYYRRLSSSVENTVSNEITNNTITNEITNNTTNNTVVNNTVRNEVVNNTVTNTTKPTNTTNTSTTTTPSSTTVIIKDSSTNTTNTTPKTDTSSSSVIKRIVNPKTGDIVPVIAYSTIFGVLVLNIILATHKRKELTKVSRIEQEHKTGEEVKEQEKKTWVKDNEGKRYK